MGAAMTATRSTDWADELRSAVTAGVDVPPEEWREFVAEIRPVTFARGELLVTQGRPIDRAFFLRAGIVRYFAQSRGRGREVTFGFDYEGRFSSDFDGFFRGVPALTSAEALEPIEAVAIPRAAMDAAYARHPCWDRVGRLMLQNALRRRADKERRLRMLTPEQRYRHLVEQGSPLATRLPQYHLAAYLGIAPETLSRIRARL